MEEKNNQDFISKSSPLLFLPYLVSFLFRFLFYNHPKKYKKMRKKETSQIEHPVFRILVWQLAVHNICKRFKLKISASGICQNNHATL
jgi:hypothetical protein